MKRSLSIISFITLMTCMPIQAYIVGYSLWNYNGKKVLILDDVHGDDVARGNINVMESVLQLNSIDLAMENWKKNGTRVDILLEFGKNSEPLLHKNDYRGVINELIKLILRKRIPVSLSSIRPLCVDYRQHSKTMQVITEAVVCFYELITDETTYPDQYSDKYIQLYHFVRKSGVTLESILNHINTYYASITKKLSGLKNMKEKFEDIKTTINFLAQQPTKVEDIFGLGCLTSLEEKKNIIEQCALLNSETLVWRPKTSHITLSNAALTVKCLCDLIIFLGDFGFIAETYKCLQVSSDTQLILVLAGLLHGKALQEFMHGIGAQKIEQVIAQDYQTPLNIQTFESLFDKLT